jgi:hypothetical protein
LLAAFYIIDFRETSLDAGYSMNITKLSSRVQPFNMKGFLYWMEIYELQAMSSFEALSGQELRLKWLLLLHEPCACCYLGLPE